MGHSSLSLYGQLRLLVGYLGEKAQKNWWSTAFFDSSSRFFLEPVYARTTRLAQYNGVREAARRLHDEKIGTGNVFHLFRLPEEMEQDLHELMIDAPDQWFAELENQSAALNALRSLSSQTITISEGPQLMGSLDLFYDSRGSTTFAQSYFAAFEQGICSFPYLMD
jgi:hypothetical protein